MKSTTSLFWTQNHLEEFQQAWDTRDPLATNWLVKIYQQGISLDGRTEVAIDKDIETLLSVAREGCNMMLGAKYASLLEKKMYSNPLAWDYLSNAWDFISAAQCTLARKWGVYIECNLDPAE